MSEVVTFTENLNFFEDYNSIFRTPSTGHATPLSFNSTPKPRIQESIQQVSNFNEEVKSNHSKMV